MREAKEQGEDGDETEEEKSTAPRKGVEGPGVWVGAGRWLRREGQEQCH